MIGLAGSSHKTCFRSALSRPKQDLAAHLDRAVEIQVRAIARCVDEDRDQWQLVNYRCTTEVQVIQAAFSSDQAEGCVARCRLQYMADHGADHGTDHGSTLDVDNTKYFCSNGTNPKQCQADIHAETHTHTQTVQKFGN